ncbi:MAG: SAM hydroxide adenosyltransferase, partial [Gaiellaceae bacterium]
GLRVLVVACDRFGTLQLACGLDQLAAAAGCGRLAVNSESQSASAVRGTTFADVESGELMLYCDSFGHPALAVRQGSAAALLGVGAGDWLSLRVL